MRNTIRLTAILLAGATFVAVGCDGMGQASLHTDRSGGFILGVEQDGRHIPIEDHRVTLARKPFRMVFFIPEMSSMLVQASYQPNLMVMARRGATVDTMFRPGRAIVEELQNPNQSVFVNTEGYQNWMYMGPRNHRFDPGGVKVVERGGLTGPRVREAGGHYMEIKDGGFLCRRTIQRVVDGHGEAKREIAVENLPRDAIYLVVVQTSRSAGGARVESARDWVEIRFLPSQ